MKHEGFTPGPAEQQREPEDVVPNQISLNAWDSAMIIDREVANLLAEHGMHRVEGRSKMTEAVAKLVQLAINRDAPRLIADASRLYAENVKLREALTIADGYLKQYQSRSMWGADCDQDVRNARAAIAETEQP